MKASTDPTSATRNPQGGQPASSAGTSSETPHRVRLTLLLNATPYTVKPIPRPNLPPGAVRGFWFSRTDGRIGKVQHQLVEAFEGLTCTCGDQTYRQSPAGGICKHLAAAQACGLF